MARYKVSITVYKDPQGKTMKGPSFLHFLGDLCQGFGLMLILGGIAWLMDGALEPMRAAVLVAAIVACFWGGSLLHKNAEKKAQARYLELLAQTGEGPEK